MKKQGSKKTYRFSKKKGFLRRILTGSDTLGLEEAALSDDDDIAQEEVISPTQRIVRDFFSRKNAVFATVVVVCMLALVIIGPLMMPKYYDSYTEVTQKNVPPTRSMLSVPSDLENDIKMIDSYGSFTVGLSRQGKVYVWGSTQLGTTGIDIGKIPTAVEEDTFAYVAAGIDHIIAISTSGKVYGWGSNLHGQFITTDREVLEMNEEAEEEVEAEPLEEEAGAEEEAGDSAEEEEPLFPEEGEAEEGGHSPERAEGENIILMPQRLVTGTIDPAHVRKLTCGYQSTAILMDDGTLYLWGNMNAYQNMEQFLTKTDLVDIDFTLNYIIGLTEKGTAVFTGKRGLYDRYRDNLNTAAVPSKDFLKGRKIVSVNAAANHISGILDDGSVFFSGNFESGTIPMPALHEGETVKEIKAGNYHYTVLTSEGRVLSFGGNTLDQAEVADGVDGVTAHIYTGAFQSYAVDENGVLKGKWGLKGYLFGTDGYGANIFHRIIQGGKMTMSIGIVSVIISMIIGIIIGCLSGYFGGKVDMLMMRIAEIFSAIPFLPTAMTLSAIMIRWDITENQKIYLLMVILGLLSWTGMARMVRAQVLVARETEYVTAAKAMGVKEWRIAFKHILPNIISIILVSVTLNFATCMLTESTLSYLGFGVSYPRPTWGNMLRGANNATIIKNFWWQWVFTSIFLSITCICINIVGDTLRDVMDPKSDRDK